MGVLQKFAQSVVFSLADIMNQFVQNHKELGEDFFAPVKPASFNTAILRYRNEKAASYCGLSDITDEEWIQHFGHFKPFQGAFESPLALAYHGHQFGVYNPDIGDGRGFLLAQLRSPVSSELLDFGTKGSGQTPFSRSGDGRLTLKGAVREILATEMLEALGVKTSKTLSVIETGESLHRHDEPSPTRSAVLVRLSQTHIRIGSFQRHHYLGQPDKNEVLARYVVRHYYPEIDANQPLMKLVPALLSAFAQKVAVMTAGWMAAGFVHGVLNTDNFNLTGESFDYGPWRFLPHLDPAFTAAYFDHQSRYAYGRQPDAALWALCRFADCFIDQIGQELLEEALQSFFAHMETAMVERMMARLGIVADTGAPIMNALLKAARTSKVGFDELFFDLYGRDEPHKDIYKSEVFAPYFTSLKNADVTYKARSHPYFAGDKPASLIIDEVERIWAPIAEKDDWSDFEDKLSHIRAYGQALGS